MARVLAEDSTVLYRVVIERTMNNGTTRKEYYGPYEHKRTAGRVRSHMTDLWFGRLPSATYIEETQTQWYQVDDGK